MEPHRKGEFTEATVVAELKRRGIPVSMPFGDNERYDVIVETPRGELVTLQVKTGRLRDGKVLFGAESQHTNSRGHVYERYDGDVDSFLVYCDELEALYLVPEREVGSRMALRVEEPEVRNSKINWATEYAFDERWPPQDDGDSGDHDDVVRESIDGLRGTGSTVLRRVDADDPRNLVVETDGALYRTRVEKGWLTDGRVRFSTCERAVDCYVVYCEANDSLYAVDDREFEQSISLRVDPVEHGRNDINWAGEYELERNWPPNVDEQSPRTIVDEAVSTAVDRLEEHGCDVEFEDWEASRRMLRVTTENGEHTVRVEHGYVTNGRLQFNAYGDGVDHYLVYNGEKGSLYVVPDDEFETSLSLRVEPPDKVDDSINWADDYAFEARWPPA